MLRVVDRYLLRELWPPLALGAGLFTFFLLIDRIYHLTELVITKGVPFHLVLELLLFMLPAFFIHTLPISLLVAILLVGGRLAGDLEIVALKAAGVSPLRVFRPVAIAAVVVALLTATMTLVLTPWSLSGFQRQLFKILQARAASGLKERVFNSAFTGTVLYIEEMSASQIRLQGLLVSDERDPSTTRIITAREGRLLTDEKDRRITLRLLDGAISEGAIAPSAAASSAVVRRGPFVTPRTEGSARTRHRYTAFSVYDMSLSVDSPLRTSSKVERPEKDLSTRELSAAIADLHRRGQPARFYEAEYHKRFAFPMAALVFALVGFPLAIRSTRGGRAFALVMSLTLVVAYYLLLTSLEDLALSRHIPVWLAIWLPNGLFLGVGAALMWATVREMAVPDIPWLWALIDRVRPAGVPALPRMRAPVARGFRGSSRLIDRYLIREYLVYLALGLGVAAVLFMVIDVLQTLDRFLRIRPPFIYVLQHFAYRLPADLHEGLPIVMLVATLFLFLMLSRYHELTALKAAGMSLFRVSLPILTLGLLASAGAALFQETLLPALNERRDEVDRVKIRGQLPRHLQQRTRTWLRSSDTRFFRIELIDPVSSNLYGVTILDTDRSFRMLGRVDAARAQWTPEGWEFSNGASRQFSAGHEVKSVPFEETALDLPERFEDFTVIQKPVSAMSYLELRAYIAKLEESGHQAEKYLVELYSKLSFPLVNLVMVLVAIPFAIQAPRSGRLLGAGLAIVIMAGYYLLHYAAVAFAKADLLPPLVAASTANVVLLGIGVSLLIRART